MSDEQKAIDYSQSGGSTTVVHSVTDDVKLEEPSSSDSTATLQTKAPDLKLVRPLSIPDLKQYQTTLIKELLDTGLTEAAITDYFRQSQNPESSVDSAVSSNCVENEDEASSCVSSSSQIDEGTKYKSVGVNASPEQVSKSTQTE